MLEEQKKALIWRHLKMDEDQFKEYVDQVLKTLYTAYSINMLFKLKSTHAVAMYELLKRHEHEGEVVLSLDEVRENLWVQDKYPRYSELKTKVILVVQREFLENKMDIYFNFEEIKEGKRVVKIKFDIFPNLEGLDSVENSKTKGSDDVG